MKNSKNIRRLVFVFLSILTLFFAGCGIWNDFTTYFNLYYNTTDAFYLAEEAIIIERNKDLFSLVEPQLPGSAVPQLQKVIEKSSKLLQFNSESSFVDDALFMLGKSFYYQGSYQKAIRKFRELISQQSESDLIREAELWIARCQLQMKDFEAAIKTLTEIKSKAVEEDNEVILVDAYIEEVKYYKFIEKYSDAIKVCKELLQVCTNGEINAQTAYQIGELNFYMLENYEQAADAYKSVMNYSPTFDMELNAQIKYGKVTRSIGKIEDALSVFEKLRKEDKNSSSYDMIDLEIGITFERLERFEEAYAKLKNVDTAYSNSVYAGPARYELGEMFELHLKNYDSAAFYYQKALSSTSTAEYLPWIRNKAGQFQKYKTLTLDIENYQKQLFYALNPEAYSKDSLDFYSDTSSTIQSTENQTGTVAPKTGRERNFEGENLQQPNITQTLNPDQVNKKPPIKPILSADSLSRIIAKTKFDKGNLFFTELNITDSAYAYYSDVAENYDSLTFLPQLIYALGSYYQTQNDYVKADSMFNIIYENYKSEKIVNAAAEKLNKPKIDFEFDPAKDFYVKAEELIKKEEFSASLKSFYSIYNDFPSSKFAPKSLLAAGWILENKLKLLDSAASVYDTLITKYPRTEYASSISPKIIFFKEEKARIKKAIEDSLQAIKDSIRLAEEQLRIKKEQDSIAIVARRDSILNANKIDSTKMEQPVDSLNQIKDETPSGETEKIEEEKENLVRPEENQFIPEIKTDSTNIKVEPTSEEKPPGLSYYKFKLNNFHHLHFSILFDVRIWMKT
jgi:TolA-binding protein